MAQDDFLEFVERVKQAESRGQRYGKDGKLLTSPKGAQGEMQVMPATQRRPGFGITPIRDESPEEIARVGRDLLKALDGYYGGNKMYAAAAYNWGKSNVDKWIAKGADFNKLPKETQGYLQRIKPETLPSMTARSAPPAQEVGPAVMEPPLGVSASAAPARSVTPATPVAAASTAVAAAPAARAEDLGSGYKAALALSFLNDDDRDRPTTDSELQDKLDETALAEFNKELEDYTPKNALQDLEITALNPIKAMQPVKMADGGEVDAGETLFNKGNELTGTSTPPRFAAKELDAYIKAANPGAVILEYNRGPGDALGFVHSKMPDVINVKKGLTPGTREQTLLHELEHSMDERGGDLFGRPKVSRMDNNYRAYYLLNQNWKPVEKFVQSVVENQDKLKNFFGQEIVSGYINMTPDTLKKLQQRGGDRGLFAEQIASLSALEQATGKSLTRDPEMRKLFPDTKMMAVYDALTGFRQTRTDARDLPPHTPLPSYTYETNPVMRFIREKTTGKNEYGIPIKRANGGEAEPTAEELDAASRPYFGNPNIARQGAAARALAAQRDVNTLPDPRTYAAVSGFLFGQAPDELGFSVMHPDLQGIKRAGEVGFAAGLVPAVAPVVAPVAKAVGKAATALGMRTEKALEAPVTRTLERGGRSAEMLKALGAQPSFAVRPRGGHFEQRPDASGPGMAVWDDVRQTVSDTLANTKDQQLNNWFNSKYATYLRRDLGTEGDLFVKAADAGKKLHIPNKPMSEDWQKTLNFVRKNEGLPPQGFATTTYGKNVEDALDASLTIRELGDLAASPYSRERIPPSLMQFVDTNPSMRLYSLDEILESGPMAESLRNTMLEMRQPAVSYYNVSIPIPKNYRLTDDTLQGLTPVQASERAALFTEWKDTARQKAATLSVRENPNISKINVGDGYLWVNPPDLSGNPQIRQVIQDIGCDGGWCTRQESFAKDYGSGDSRLSILIDNKSRPVAQMTIEDLGAPDPKHFIRLLSPEDIAAFRSNPLYRNIEDDELHLFADSFPQYDQYVKTGPHRISVTEIKARGNRENVVDTVSPTDLKKIQDRIKYLDEGFDLQYVENLKGIGLTEIPRKRPDLIHKHFNILVEDRLPLKQKFGSETAGFKAILDEAIKMNKGSKYFSGNEDEISELFHRATRSVLRNEAQTPVNRATGGMVERQNTDNRAYL
jgi:hypothetical protein